jgi:hypothetical protein
VDKFLQCRGGQPDDKNSVFKTRVILRHQSTPGEFMTVDNINVEETVKTVRELIAQEKNLSPSLKGSLEVMIFLVLILVNCLGLNSRNSSQPPVADPYRKKAVRTAGDRKAGGQPGDPGKTLKQVTDPDIECPGPTKKASHWKSGKIARSKSRNLLERLIKFEDAVELAVETIKIVAETGHAAMERFKFRQFSYRFRSPKWWR